LGGTACPPSWIGGKLKFESAGTAAAEFCASRAAGFEAVANADEAELMEDAAVDEAVAGRAGVVQLAANCRPAGWAGAGDRAWSAGVDVQAAVANAACPLSLEATGATDGVGIEA
jgi:hypothetical protein